MNMQKIWFTSDTHFGHKNVLKHCPGRLKAFGIPEDVTDEEKVRLHDEYLIQLWNGTIGRKDIVYIIGDFSFYNVEKTRKILSRLNGSKFLIIGNHDKSSVKLGNYFQQITHIKEIDFKKKNFDFLEEDFGVVCCHYPMVTWNRKHYGTANVHGHCHGRLDCFNNDNSDLRVDVGIDGCLSNFGIVSLESLYYFFKSKTDGKPFSEYASEMKQKNTMII